MKTENAEQMPQLPSAPTLLESLQASRRQKGKPPVQTQSMGPGGDEGGGGEGGGSQVTIRQMNPDGRPVQSEKDTPFGRRIQQDQRPKAKSAAAERSGEGGEGSGDEGGGKEAGSKGNLDHILGSRMFGADFAERAKKRREEEEKKAKAKAGKDGAGSKPKPTAGKEDDGSGGEEGAGKKQGVEVTKIHRIGADEIEAIASGAAKAVIAAQAPTKKEAADDDQGEEATLKLLDEDDQYSYSVAQQMAQSSPDKYKDLPEKFLDMGKQKREYRASWMKDNPGKKFNWEDSDHEAFLEQVTPEFVERDFEDGRIELRAAKIADSRMKDTNDRINEIEATAIQATLKDAIQEEVESSVGEYSKEFGLPGDVDLSTAAGRKKAITENPELGKIAVSFAVMLENAMTELTKIYRSRGTYKVDPKNDLHMKIVDVVETEEAKLAKARPKRGNQTLVTRAEYRKMSEAQRKNHWHIGEEEAKWIIRQAIISSANMERDAELDRIESIFKRQGVEFNREDFIRKSGGQSGGGEGGGEGDETPDKSGEEERPPTNAGSDKVDTGSEVRPSKNKKLAQVIVGRLFNRGPKKE